MKRHQRLAERVDALAATVSDSPAIRRVFWHAQATAPLGAERRRRCLELAEQCAPMPSTWPPAELGDVLEEPPQ